MAAKRQALGKGLSALLNDNDDVSEKSSQELSRSKSVGSIAEIPVVSIKTNPYQPRTEFEKERLEELSESIKVQGIIQPITVRRFGDNQYQLISGERRLRASKLAGLEMIPAYIREANDQQMLEMALIENIQRENLNSIEVAISFKRLLDECDLKQEELGDRVGKNRSTVTNYLRLLKLPPAIQAGIKDGRIGMGHARAIISVEDVDVQLYIYNETITRELSVRKVEQLVRSIGESKVNTPKKDGAKEISFEIRRIQDELSSKFGTKVSVTEAGNDKGQIVIPYLSNEDLSRILELLDW
ncbi:MAG: ParB family chromosome partitioning protein [Sphingobacteriales bacterium]|jgi:ParB family chromosome partitioning protein